ncbi:hypothetical protein Tco_1578651 [Tanacetum coccineum]
MSRCRQTEYSANGSQFDNRTKGLITVHTNLLIATISNKASLVPAKGSICKILVLEQPHGTKNVRDRFDIIEAGMRDVMIDSGGEGSILSKWAAIGSSAPISHSVVIYMGMRSGCECHVCQKGSEGCGCQTQHHGRIGKPLLQLLMKYEKELNNLRSSVICLDGAVVAYAWNLLLTEPEVPDVNTLTYERLDWSKQSSLLARSSSETLDEPPKDHGFHSSRDIRSGSGGVVAPDQIPLL